MNKLNQLELLLDIVDLGSLTKAAERRNLDRSVASKQLKLLEQDLGVVLLNRSTRSISLTEAGRSVSEKARQVRYILNDIKSEAQYHQVEPKGKLRITSFTSFGYHYLTTAIAKFMTNYPKVEIELVLEDRRSDMIKENFDLAFRIGPPKDSSLIAKKIASNKLVFVASTSFFDTHILPKSLVDLMELPAIIYANGELCFNQFEYRNANAKNSPIEKYKMQGRYYVNNVQSQLAAVQAGIGYGLLSQSTLNAPLTDLGLVSMLDEYVKSIDAGQIYAVYPTRNQTPLVKQFLALLDDSVGVPPIWESYVTPTCEQ